jgi:mutator protein MutT
LAYPNLTLTFLIEFQEKYLLIKRLAFEKNFPSLWAFPGGKVEEGETAVDTIRREVKEETNLELRDEFVPLNSYCFPGSVGMAFLVRATSSVVSIRDCDAHEWISNLADLQRFPCIPGIHNHLVDAMLAFGKHSWLSLEAFRLSRDKYINR